VYAGNAADAVAAVLTTEAARNELFYASDGQDVSTAELTRAIGSALGRRARLIAVPPRLLACAARAGDVVERALPCPVTSATLQRLIQSLVVDITKLRTVTGYTPRMTLAAGLAETASRYRCTPT
jgi:nucleoside-diphosphate-sugar epimerase